MLLLTIYEEDAVVGCAGGIGGGVAAVGDIAVLVRRPARRQTAKDGQFVAQVRRDGTELVLDPKRGSTHAAYDMSCLSQLSKNVQPETRENVTLYIRNSNVVTHGVLGFLKFEVFMSNIS